MNRDVEYTLQCVLREPRTRFHLQNTRVDTTENKQTCGSCQVTTIGCNKQYSSASVVTVNCSFLHTACVLNARFRHAISRARFKATFVEGNTDMRRCLTPTR